MLHQYVERVWSFGYVFSWEVIHYWSEYVQKNKKKVHCSLYRFPLSTCMDVLVCFIEFMCYREFVWEFFFWDSILVYVLGESMSHPFDFYERDQRLFFRIFGSLPYLSLYPFSYDFFIFSFCLMFDLGSASTLYSCLFDTSFIYYHFSCGNP